MLEIVKDSFKNKKLNFFYIYTLFVCLFVCPFVFNKRQNSWTNQAQIVWPKGRFMDDQSWEHLNGGYRD